MFSLLCPLAAFAADGSDGVVLPGASPLETTVSIGASAAGYGVYGTGSTGALGGEASLRLSDRLGVIGFGGLVQVYTVANGGATKTYNGLGLVSVRYLAVSKAALNVAPMLTAAVVDQGPLRGSVGLGLALEGGGENVRVDLSAPSLFAMSAGLAGTAEYGLRPRLFTTGAEVGVTWRIAESHEVRVGLPAMITWRVQTDRVFFELSSSFLLLAVMGSAELGVRF